MTKKRNTRPLVYLLVFYTSIIALYQTWCNRPLRSCSSIKNCDESQRKETSVNISTQDMTLQRYMEHNSPRITTSPKSKRRFLATVVSMPDAYDRRKVFFNAWEKVWPDLSIFPMHSFANSPDLMGYALLATNVQQMHKALSFSNSTGQDFDYLMILEDDALPFQNASWPGDLDQALDEFEEKGGGALYLGCHAVYSWERKKLIEQGGSYDGHIAEIVWAYGSYAWMIPRSHLVQLYDYFRHVLKEKKGVWDGASDTSAQTFFMEQNISHHVMVPLLVDHQSHGKSSTFGEKDEYKDAVQRWYSFEGHRDWWNFEDKIGIFQPPGLPKMNNRGETSWN